MKKIKFLTAGESHGELLMGILEGIPSNLKIDETYIHEQLKRRQLGFGRGKRMQIENRNIADNGRYTKNNISNINNI